MKYYEVIQSRIQRQKRFFASNQAGDILFCRIGSSWGGDYLLPQVQDYWLDNVLEKRTMKSLQKNDISKIDSKFLKEFRASLENYFRFDDDAVPNIEVYFGIGDMTAAMSGGEVIFSSHTSWSEPVVHRWEDIAKLKFDPENISIQFHLLVYQDLANKWEGDFLMVPFLHRSPLDAAYGLRGNDIFYDFTDNPQFVKDLTNWCAEWSIQFEKYILSNTVIPKGLERGVWGVWIPEGCVWVNGDPVDLISGDMQQEFERPSTEKLFTTLGGGFFHHHAKGIRHVTNISKTKGMIIQNIISDPNEPNPLSVLQNDPEMRDRILEASMKQPIHLNGDNYFYNNIDKILPILAEGRFIIRYEGDDELSGEIIDKIKKVRKNN